MVVASPRRRRRRRPAGHVCTTTTTNNFNHVQAGRATTSGGQIFAVGSGDAMGLFNTFITNTLAQTAAGFYKVGNCP